MYIPREIRERLRRTRKRESGEGWEKRKKERTCINKKRRRSCLPRGKIRERNVILEAGRCIRGGCGYGHYYCLEDFAVVVVVVVVGGSGGFVG